MSRMSFAERSDRFDRDLAAAASATDADNRLAAMLTDPALNRWEQTKVAAELGEVPRGPAGSAALRQAFSAASVDLTAASKSTRAEYRDLVCACVTALARRDGAEATDVCITALGSPNAIVRDYGMSALAPIGDDRAWEQVMTWLEEIRRRKISAGAGREREALYAVEYLARHARRGSDRTARLVTLLRRRWHRFPDPEVISRWYPGVQSDGRAVDELDLPGAHAPHAWWAGPPSCL